MTSKFQKDLRKELSKIEKQFIKTVSPTAMKKIGNEAVMMVRTRTRVGFGVSGSRKQKLKKLSASYVKTRKKLKKAGQLDSTTGVRKSNLTNTGQMLRSLKIKKANSKSVKIGASGRRQGSRLGNEKLSRFVTIQGRPFLDLTESEEKKLARFYQNKILKPALARV